MHLPTSSPRRLTGAAAIACTAALAPAAALAATSTHAAPRDTASAPRCATSRLLACLNFPPPTPYPPPPPSHLEFPTPPPPRTPPRPGRRQGGPPPGAGRRAQRTGRDGHRAGNARRPRSWSGSPGAVAPWLAFPGQGTRGADRVNNAWECADRHRHAPQARTTFA